MMLDFPRWKMVMVMTITAFFVFTALPNALTLPNFLPQATMPLGLDLRGGSHLLLELDFDTYKREHFTNTRDALREALRNAKVGYTDLRASGNEVSLRIRPETVGEGVKLAWLREHLPDLLRQGRRVLVFSQFARMLDLVEALLSDLKLAALRLSGETPESQRGERVSRFQTGECPLMLLSLKAGGVGLNLTAADTVIHLDPWWNPAVQAQASARAHRIGQDKPVFVHQLLVQGSIEERILALQARKRALAEGVMGVDGAAELLKFSAADLDGLLAPLPALEMEGMPDGGARADAGCDPSSDGPGGAAGGGADD